MRGDHVTVDLPDIVHEIAGEDSKNSDHEGEQDQIETGAPATTTAKEKYKKRKQLQWLLLIINTIGPIKLILFSRLYQVYITRVVQNQINYYNIIMHVVSHFHYFSVIKTRLHCIVTRMRR